MASSTAGKDVLVTIKGKIGIIKLNRPNSLNAFGGSMMPELISAIRELNSHPETVFTVLTGSGRFFSAGADVRGSGLDTQPTCTTTTEKKLFYLQHFGPAIELLRQIIDHRKVFILALNGPAVGGGAAWFTGIADLVYASTSAYLQIPFSALGLVPENGSAINFAQSMGVHRANEFFIFGRKLTAKELEDFGIVNMVFPQDSFEEDVLGYLEEQVKVNDGKSMMEAKRLMNAPLREGRMAAVLESVDALSERFVEGAPGERFKIKKAELEAKSRGRGSKM